MDDQCLIEESTYKSIHSVENWQIIADHLPAGWKDQARTLGAMRRTRCFESPEVLLRALLIHLAEGCSLRETAVRARQGELAKVSDVAIMKRLRASDEWLRWMAFELARPRRQSEIPDGNGKYRILVVDATTVSEPGSTGTDWRLHYVLELKTLRCDFFELTDVGGGETLLRIPIRKGDLILADRCYEGMDGIHHVLREGGDVLLRMRVGGPSLETPGGGKFDLMRKLGGLKIGDTGEWPVRLITTGKEPIAGRMCAVRRSESAAGLAREKVLKEARRKGKRSTDNALKAAGYVFVFTTVGDGALSAKDVLELYRGRWQIEMCFKRLKSVIGFGHLPKHDERSCRAWLHGKLLVSLIAERLLDTARNFSPWGYELQKEEAELP